MPNFYVNRSALSPGVLQPLVPDILHPKQYHSLDFQFFYCVFKDETYKKYTLALLKSSLPANLGRVSFLGVDYPTNPLLIGFKDIEPVGKSLIPIAFIC